MLFYMYFLMLFFQTCDGSLFVAVSVVHMCALLKTNEGGTLLLKKAKGGLLVTKSTKLSKSALLNALLHVFLNALLPKMSKKSLLHFLFVILDSIAENKRRGDPSLKKSKGGTLGNKKYQTLKKCTFKCTFTCIFKCSFKKNVKKLAFAFFVCHPCSDS